MTASAMPIAGEECQRALRTVELQDGAQDAEAVAPGAELRVPSPPAARNRASALRRPASSSSSAWTVSSVSISKPPREHRERFDEPPREHPVARQDVGEGRPEYRGEKAGQQPVAGAVAAAVGGLVAGRRGRRPPCRAARRSGARSTWARWARHRSRRRRPGRRCRRRRRRTCGAPRYPCPGGARGAPPRRRRGRPRSVRSVELLS